MIKEKKEWNLDHVLPIADFEKLSLKIEKDLKKISKFSKILKPEIKEDKFKQILEFLEKLDENLAKLICLPSLMETVNQNDKKAKLFKTKANNLLVKYNEKIIKIDRWVKGLKIENKKKLDQKNAKRLFKVIPDLEYELTHKREAAKYTLEEREEKIIFNKNINGVESLNDLLTLIRTEFEYTFGKKNIKTLDELLSYIYSSKKEERKEAYQSLLKKYEKNIEKFFIVYQAVVKNWDYEANLRGYDSPIQIRNFDNHISDKAIEIMINVTKRNKKIFQNYFKYKAKELKLNKIERFDLYTPIRAKRKKMDFQDAIALILETFGEFSTRFRLEAEKIINQNHIDSHPNQNKRSGAFCLTVGPQITPYIMTNYTGDTRSVTTLAHELGHGIHSLYANKHYYSSQIANLPLAETASTLAEMILFEKMFKEEKDLNIKKTMLSEKIADSYATILRQNFIVDFEIKAHEIINKGTTVKELSNLWLKTLKEQFGTQVKIDPIFKYEWAHISHIFNTPFYCYAYNFGELLSYSLFKRYKEEGKEFALKIEKLLETGGSEEPVKILKNLDIDIESESFWEDSFEIIKNWQKQLEIL